MAEHMPANRTIHSNVHDNNMKPMTPEVDVINQSNILDLDHPKTKIPGDEQLLNGDTFCTKVKHHGDDDVDVISNTPEINTEGRTEDIIETRTTLVPDGGYGWVVVFASFMVHFLLIGGIERSAGLFYLQFINRYHGSAAVTAWLTAIASGIRLLLGPLTSALSHRYSCRAVVMWGGVITCISMIISGVSPSLPFQFLSFGILGGPLTSALSHRYSCRAVVMWGGVITCISMIISGVSPSLPFQFLSFGILGGIGRSFAYCPAVVIVGYYFNKKRGRAVGIATSGVGFGTFIISNIIELMFDHYGFVGAFLIIAGITFNLTMCGILMRPLGVHKKIQNIQKRKNEKVLAADIGTKSEQKESQKVRLKPKPRDGSFYDSIDFTILVHKGDKSASKKDLCGNLSRRLTSAVSFFKQNKTENQPKPKKKLFEFSLLKDYRFTCFCLAIILYTIAFQSAFVFLPPYVKQIGGSNMKAAFSIVIAGVFDGVGRLTAGFVLDLKHTRPYRYYVYNGIMLLIGSISMIIPSLTSFLPLAIVCGVYGFLVGSYISQKSVVIVDLLGPDKLTFSFGIMILFQGIGMLIGPVVGGILKDVNGTYDYAFYFDGTSMLVVFIILGTSNIIHYISNRK